jgi:uncharacterized membrane protein
MIPDAYLWIQVGVLFVALLATASFQILGVRLAGMQVVDSLLAAFVPGVLVLAAAEGWLLLRGSESWNETLALAAANAILFVCGWYFYFHFINIGEASLRIRVLREAAVRPGCSLEDLLLAYNVGTVVGTRLDRLVADGQLRRVGDRYHAGKPRMVVVAKAFRILRWLLLGNAVAGQTPKTAL